MASLNSILKTTRLSGSTLRELQVDNDKVVGVSSGDKNLSKSKKLKNVKFGI